MSEEETTANVVELDALVVLKIIKHCQSALPAFVTGAAHERVAPTRDALTHAATSGARTMGADAARAAACPSSCCCGTTPPAGVSRRKGGRRPPGGGGQVAAAGAGRAGRTG